MQRPRPKQRSPPVLAPVKTGAQVARQSDRSPARASKKARANSDFLSACPTYRCSGAAASRNRGVTSGANRARGNPPRATGRTSQVAPSCGRQLQQLVGQQWNENGAKQDGERRATGSHGFDRQSV